MESKRGKNTIAIDTGPPRMANLALEGMATPKWACSSHFAFYHPRNRSRRAVVAPRFYFRAVATSSAEMKGGTSPAKLLIPAP